MCRFTLYLGPPIRLSTLLIDPAHSLIHQSVKSREREEPLNGDGFGVSWYAREFSEEPAIFRSITPAWNNRNLHNLARVIASPCIFAHVRAATQSSGVNEANCHPFRFGRYTFMHNGDIGNFRKVRRKLLESVSDVAFSNVYGSTDSEHFFAILIDELLQRQLTGPMAIASALDAAIERVVELVDRYGDGEPSFLNIAIGDGENAVVSRYCNAADEQAESLYYYCGHLYECASKDYAGDGAILVSSEKLSEDPDWQPVPANHMVVMGHDHRPEIIQCGTLAR